MAEIDVYGGGAINENSPLLQILRASEISAGNTLSYELCKLIYLYHPLGKKTVDSPIARAMYKRREIVVKESPECVVERFNDVWEQVQADYYIADCERLARIYGIASLAVIPTSDRFKTSDPITPEQYWSGEFRFNSLDPLNTAGSLVGILNPNDPEFLKYQTIAVMGQPYHRSRTHIQLYENPIYLSYTGSAFGYVGRSVFSRALYPLQSFVQSMVADNLMMVKSGVMVAKIKQPGSIIDRLMAAAQDVRLNILKIARTGNTISIMPDESIESLDLNNLTYQDQRKNILENIALSLDMPPSFLTGDSLSQGFGEGSEDAKLIAGYIDRVRLDMDPIYKYMDNIVMHTAWSPEYYQSLQNRVPEYRSISYEQWFTQCKRSFQAIWPEALQPEKKERTDHQKNIYTSVLEVYNTIGGECTGNNKAALLDWVIGNLNEAEDLFPNKLSIDTDEIALRSALGLDQPPPDNDETSPQVPGIHVH